MLVFMVRGARQNFSLSVILILVISMTEIVRASFLFVCNLHCHHKEWKGSMTTNRHGVASFDFATVSSCHLLVIGPTHEHGALKKISRSD